MSTFLSENLGVAESGVMWDVGNFKIFQSGRPDVCLFITREPQLVKGPDGRFEAAVTAYHQQQPDRSYKITGGSALFNITSAPQYEPKAFLAMQDSWRAAMGPDGRNAKFIPLNVQKGHCRVVIDSSAGVPNQANNDQDVGTPGGTTAFLVELTELGAQAWAQGIKNHTAIPGTIQFGYEYLRMMPTVSARVHANGRRVFQHLSGALNASYKGLIYGGSAQIEAAWQEMQRNGILEIEFEGGGLSPDLEKMRQDLVNTFINQVQQRLFDAMFRPAPEITAAKAGNTGGLAGGVNFALTWNKESEAIDIDQTVRFKGWTWLQARMDTTLTSLFAQLDAHYLTEVETQQSTPVSVVVSGDPIVSTAAVSVSFSEGHAPEAPVFTKDGGNERYIVTSMHPDQVLVKYTAKIDYAVPRWPVVQSSGAAKIADGGNQIVIKPAASVGRVQIYMYVRDGDRILSPDEMANDYLILNVSYSAPFLKTPIRDSARLSGMDMVEFSYPIDPTHPEQGVAKFSAFGVVGGKLVRSKEQTINKDETAVFVLVSRAGAITLVSQDSVLAEDDDLAQSLREAGVRPVVSDGVPAPDGPTLPAPDGAVLAVEADRPGPPASNGHELAGTTVAVEYGPDGPSLWVQDPAGQKRRVRLRTLAETVPFETSRKRVRVKLDDSGEFPEGILVLLEGQ